MGNQQGLRGWNTWDINSYSQMTGLSPAQIQQLYNVFNQQAAATGGRLTINQFKTIYASIAGLTWNFNADAERVFLMFDRDGNGVLTFDEFLMAYLMLQRNVNPAQRWSFVLNSYNTSQPGYLSAQDAQLLLNQMQRFYNFPMQDTYFTNVWSQFGGGTNGYVPASSFIEVLIPLIPATYIW